MKSITFGVISPRELVLSDRELSARLMRSVSASDTDISLVCREIIGASNMRFAAARLKILGINADKAELEGISVVSSALSAYFSGASETYIFAATLGSEVDRLIMKKRALSLADGFVFDAVASAVTEAMCEAVERRICQSDNTKPRFSPGYADCPLSVQKELMSILSADKYTGIKLLDSLLMTPMKSVSAFVAIKGEK